MSQCYSYSFALILFCLFAINFLLRKETKERLYNAFAYVQT